jgi:hypothetical protein
VRGPAEKTRNKRGEKKKKEMMEPHKNIERRTPGKKRDQKISKRETARRMNYVRLLTCKEEEEEEEE